MKWLVNLIQWHHSWCDTCRQQKNVLLASDLCDGSWWPVKVWNRPLMEWFCLHKMLITYTCISMYLALNSAKSKCHLWNVANFHRWSLQPTLVIFVSATDKMPLKHLKFNNLCTNVALQFIKPWLTNQSGILPTLQLLHYTIVNDTIINDNTEKLSLTFSVWECCCNKH